MEAGTAGSGLDLGGCAKDALNVLKDAIGLVEGAAGGHDVVENETAFVHLWEQVGAEVAVANIRPDHEDKTGDAQPKRAGERLVEQAAMNGEDAHHEAAGVVVVRGDRAGVGFAGGVEQDEAEAGSPCKGKDKRGKQRGGHGDSECAEEAAGNAADRNKRKKDNHRGDGGADERDSDFAEGIADGSDARFPGIAMEDDVFDDNDGIVNDQANGSSEAAEGHQVEALTDGP